MEMISKLKRTYKILVANGMRNEKALDYIIHSYALSNAETKKLLESLHI